jgi:hypothetical protein
MYQRIPILAPVDKPRLTQPTYDPNLAGRRCSSCGQRDGWRRLVDDLNPGGWACCTPYLTHEHHPEMRHECSALCGLDGAA